ncbi:glucosidase II beta subunit-like protein-domain-containing protein [Diplogelasinospora grovesii]|uniref:Endoplasmic reticulum lectin n=1 Tax=Diplogelasinospora grovesii TaxID=303347 RepID=A0AAN6S1Q7_9PEZI|nr:glucosidase II beta subunit-like protein-domain-containing protein [Diplogelasinospora grovesii]
MRRLNLVLLATLQLCRARQPSFSIHDDLLAHPQFEVVFSDSYISESEALTLLERSGSPHATFAAGFSSQTDLTSNVRESATADPVHAKDNNVDDDSQQISETYEIINTPPSKYLCAVPVIAPPPALNQTATELAKAEEARELARASTKGWELMSDLEGQCLYFISGWWSYSFCYGKEIVQFHALPTGKQGGAPVKDPNSQEYVLGRTYPTHPTQSGQRYHANQNQNQKPIGQAAVADSQPKGVAPPNTELQVKGDQRYLVQRLDGGTICDLTGRERTIEVQYHCSPGSTVDRIGWIKEVTTCTYLMVVQTPRLCADVAFLPPKETRANPITCRQIIRSDEELAVWHQSKTIEAIESMGGASAQQQPKGLPGSEKNHQFAGMTIGGIVVGGRQILGASEEGQPAAKLPPPRHFAPGKAADQLMEIIVRAQAKSDGSNKIEILTEEELEKLNLEPELIEELRREFQKYAGDDTWSVEVVEVTVEGADEEEGNAGEKKQTEKNQGQGRKDSKKAGSPKKDGKAKAKQDDDDEGSQEIFFKEEL